MSTNIGKTGVAYHRLWHHVDATDRNLFELCAGIAKTLMGKHKPIYHPGMPAVRIRDAYFGKPEAFIWTRQVLEKTSDDDCGDYVVVTNVRDVRPEPEKLFEFDTRRPGLKPTKDWDSMMKSSPEEIIRRDVQRMMPKNRIRRLRLARLKIFAGPDHSYKDNFVRRYDDAIVGDLRRLTLDPRANKWREIGERQALRLIEMKKQKERRIELKNKTLLGPPDTACEILPGSTIKAEG